MKLGLLPFSQSPKDFQFSTYRTDAPLPKHPKSFGHENLIKEWGMMGNDQYGDCVLAGATHEEMLWIAESGGDPTGLFNEETALQAYSEVTGFRRDDPSTDQGTDMRAAANFRRKTGLIDTKGNRHKIGAFTFIKTVEEMREAIWLFGAMGFGFQFPKSAMDQFNAGQPWHNVKGSPIDGGHYVPGVAGRAMLEFVTWSKIQPAMVSFINRNIMTGIAYFSEEFLSEGKSPEGFDRNQLVKDLSKL